MGGLASRKAQLCFPNPGAKYLAAGTHSHPAWRGGHRSGRRRPTAPLPCCFCEARARALGAATCLAAGPVSGKPAGAPAFKAMAAAVGADAAAAAVAAAPAADEAAIIGTEVGNNSTRVFTRYVVRVTLGPETLQASRRYNE